MTRRVIWGVVVLAVIAAAALIIRNRSGKDRSPVEESVRRARIERGQMLVSVTATGSIIPKDEVRLSFHLPGKVGELWVEVGDSIRQGDKLARLDDVNLAFNVRQAKAALAAMQAQLNQLKVGPRQEEVDTANANLAAAQAALEGAAANLRELERGADEFQVATAAANLNAAQASLRLTALQSDQVAAGASDAEVAAAEAQVAASLLQLKIAQDTYDQTLRCTAVMLPTGEEREVCPGLGTPEEQARYNLMASDKALQAAQAQLDQLLAGATQNQIDIANANVAVATAQRDAAQAQLDQLRAGPSAEQLAAARANLEALKAQRDATQAQLELLVAGATPFQIAAAQANVDQAQVTLEMAESEVERATLLAPVAGVVTAVNIQQGELAPASLPAVTLADVSELQIVVNVDEIDVARIAEGQEVSITVDALPGQMISGRVKRIAPAASQMAGVVVYQVTIVLDETDLPLRVGMSATASVIIEELADVLLVPNWAIRIDRDSGKTLVNLLRADEVIEAEVELGVRGADVSQVLSGLREGDVVVAGDVVGLRTLLNSGD